MKDNYIIIHGSFESPFDHWFSWARSELQDAIVPQFPTGLGRQNYENWEKLLESYRFAGYIHENTIFIGHSIAPIFLIHYLLKHKIKVKKLFFISGFNNYSVDQSGEYDQVNESFFCDGIQKIKQYATDIICFYSDDDPYVSFSALTEFASQVATKEVFVSGAGHFNTESGYVTFPRLIEEINQK